MTELDTPLFIPPDGEEVATAQLLHSPPRKRSRNFLEIEETSMKALPRYPPEIVRDEDYYLSDGSCIILVENTLFNVSPLGDHSFSSLMPSRRCTEQLFRKIHPLLVPCSHYRGETSQLKASRTTTQSSSVGIPSLSSATSYGRCMPCELLSLAIAFYPYWRERRPHELLQVHSSLSNLTRLIDIASISNKYSFRSLETWALDVIVDTITRKGSHSPPFPLVGLGSTPAPPTSTYILQSQVTNNEQIVALVRLAQMCQHE